MFILTKKEISTIVTVRVMDLLFKNNPTLLTQITLVNKHTDLKKKWTRQCENHHNEQKLVWKCKKNWQIKKWCKYLKSTAVSPQSDYPVPVVSLSHWEPCPLFSSSLHGFFPAFCRHTSCLWLSPDRPTPQDRITGL